MTDDRIIVRLKGLGYHEITNSLNNDERFFIRQECKIVYWITLYKKLGTYFVDESHSQVFTNVAESQLKEDIRTICAS